ncbi:MAG TPA: alpha/beta fold hydrolase [Jatrophihabitantaceae bacterium]
MTASRIRYGTHPDQFGELHLPTGPPIATVVVIHGGFWRAQYTLDLGTPLAADLAERGYAAWNLEYRRVGSGGGWPATFADVAAGIDALAELPVDTTRVVTVGHSAGGQLAVWAAGRDALPADAPGARPRVRLTAAVAQAGVLDLSGGYRAGIGGGMVADLMGASPEQDRMRYESADPLRQVPLPVPVVCLHARADQDVPFAHSVDYVAAAERAGAQAELIETPGDHYSLIHIDTPAWQLTVDAVGRLTSGS